MTLRRLLTGLGSGFATEDCFSGWSMIGQTTGTGSASDTDFFRRRKKDEGFLVSTCACSLGAGGDSRGGACCDLIWLATWCVLLLGRSPVSADAVEPCDEGGSGTVAEWFFE